MTAFSVGVAKHHHFRNRGLIQQPYQNGHSWLVGWWEDIELGCCIVWSSINKFIHKFQHPNTDISPQRLLPRVQFLLLPNRKTELLTFIVVLFPLSPSTSPNGLRLFFFPLSLPSFLLFFLPPTSFLSSPVAFLLSAVWWRPCLAGEPTPDPVIARRSRRIASLPVGRGHRNGLKKREGERETERKKYTERRETKTH